MVYRLKVFSLPRTYTLSAAHKTTEQLKRPAILVTLTAGELKSLRVIAAEMDMPVKHLAERIVSDWLEGKKNPKPHEPKYTQEYSKTDLEGLLD